MNAGPQPIVSALLAAGMALLVAGCGSPPGPLFGPPDPSLAWPPPPEPARIRWVGELSTTEDLKPGRGALAGLGEVLFGKDDPKGLSGPRSAVITRDGRRLWVADPGRHCLHALDLDDRTYRHVEKAGEARLSSPVGLCTGPGGTIFVCDSRARAIHLLDAASGSLVRTLRLPVEVFRPVALAWQDQDAELFVVDAQAHDVKVLDQEGSLLRILGRRGEARGEFNYPCGIALAGERVWVADSGNQRVQALTITGEPVVSLGRAGDAPGDMALPKDVAVDSEGHVYVVDGRFENVQVFNQAGELLLRFGEEGTGPAQFWLPSGIHIDASDRIWICDSYNKRIQVFDFISREAAEYEDRLGEREPDRGEGR